MMLRKLGEDLKLKKVAILLALIFCIYNQTINFGFFNIDDDHNIYEDKNVTRGVSLDGIIWSLSTFHVNRYVPITTISQQIDCSLFGLWAGGHHLSSVFYFLISVIMLYAFLKRYFGCDILAFFTSCCFAVHPMNVETVVWLTQRNDILAGLFVFSSLYFFSIYKVLSSRRSYIISILCYVLALMSKGTVLGFPSLILGLNIYFPHNNKPDKIKQKILEILPYLILSGIFGLLALQANKVPIEPFIPLHGIARIANACMAYLVYIKNILMPYSVGSYVFYNGQFTDLTLSLLIAFVSISLFFVFYKKSPAFLKYGLVVFFLMSFPMTGVVSIIGQAFADRYVYIAKIGILFAIVFFIKNTFVFKSPFKKILLFGILLFLSLKSYWLTSQWSENKKYWLFATQCEPKNEIAQLNLGIMYLNEGNIPEAFKRYNESITINPEYSDAHLLLGLLYLQHNQAEMAFSCFRKASQIRPYGKTANLYYASMLAKSGRLAEAAFVLDKLLTYYPNDLMLKAQADEMVKKAEN